VIGGVLSELGWRYVFLLHAPITAVLALAAIRVLDASDEPSLGHSHYDLRGALTARWSSWSTRSSRRRRAAGSMAGRSAA
jgi:predicted MFS family arabinose efflux permease